MFSDGPAILVQPRDHPGHQFTRMPQGFVTDKTQRAIRSITARTPSATSQGLRYLPRPNRRTPRAAAARITLSTNLTLRRETGYHSNSRDCVGIRGAVIAWR